MLYKDRIINIQRNIRDNCQITIRSRLKKKKNDDSLVFFTYRSVYEIFDIDLDKLKDNHNFTEIREHNTGHEYICGLTSPNEF